MELTLENLRAGMAKFRAHWPKEKDFHASYYADLKRRLKGGVSTDVWKFLVDGLAQLADLCLAGAVKAGTP